MATSTNSPNRIHKIKITDIKVVDRQRIDYGDIAGLAESISRLGLIQPIIINQDNRLIAGGRRLEAHKLLNKEHIFAIYRETLSEDELFVLELEENIQRKDQTWQEQCMHIAKIHEMKVKLAAADLHSWGMRETGAMLSISVGNIQYNIRIAEKLKAELALPEDQRKYHKCDRLFEAMQLLLRERQDALLAEQAERLQEASKNQTGFDFSTFDTPPEVTEKPEITTSEPTDAEKEYARKVYLSNPLNPPDAFDSYYEEKLQLRAKQNKVESKLYIPLTSFLRNGDSIAHMEKANGIYDHIITDIPYGIDMDMLNQQNPHGSMSDIDTVEAEHQVKQNETLIADFYRVAFNAVKERGFVITWADQMQWQYMYDCAVKAGFAVQRWPITWVKTSSCMNQCAQFNTTKNTEIAIVARKKGTTLANQPQTSVITAPRDELCEKLGHPFAKPFAVWDFLLTTFTFPRQVILEPFAGRGSGVISMLKANRTPIGIELNTAHYNALLQNVKQYYIETNPNCTFNG